MIDLQAVLKHCSCKAQPVSHKAHKVQADLEQLSKLANLFLLPVESLKNLVEGELRLSNAQALPLIRLRADCKTARLNGLSLEAAFAGM